MLDLNIKVITNTTSVKNDNDNKYGTKKDWEKSKRTSLKVTIWTSAN